MDATIVVSDKRAECRKLRDLKAGDQIVVGMRGIRVVPDTKDRDRSSFSFMSNEVSSERQVETDCFPTTASARTRCERSPTCTEVRGELEIHIVRLGRGSTSQPLNLARGDDREVFRSQAIVQARKIRASASQD